MAMTWGRITFGNTDESGHALESGRYFLEGDLDYVEEVSTRFERVAAFIGIAEGDAAPCHCRGSERFISTCNDLQEHGRHPESLQGSLRHRYCVPRCVPRSGTESLADPPVPANLNGRDGQI